MALQFGSQIFVITIADEKVPLRRFELRLQAVCNIFRKLASYLPCFSTSRLDDRGNEGIKLEAL